MTPAERVAMLTEAGLVSASCLLCGNVNPPVAGFDFDEFWVRDTRDWPDYRGGPVHRVCAALQGTIARQAMPTAAGEEGTRAVREFRLLTIWFAVGHLLAFAWKAMR